jgi:hypothetical protein
VVPPAREERVIVPLEDERIHQLAHHHGAPGASRLERRRNIWTHDDLDVRVVNVAPSSPGMMAGLRAA